MNARISFWRTKDGAEVDFVVDLGGKIIGVEAKNKELEKVEIQRSTKSFIEKYQPKKVFVVNKNLSQKTKIGKTEVCFVPFYFKDFLA